MSYSGIYIKPNSTTQDFQEIVDSYYNGVLGMRESEEKMRLQNIEYKKEYERRILEAGTSGASGTSGYSGCSGVSSSNNSKDLIRHMVSQVYYVADKCPSNWIYMWIKKFRNEPEILLAFNYQNPVWLLKQERKEKLDTLQNLSEE